jgi:CubicO group peptidase (beta-lactamase class C family)
MKLELTAHAHSIGAGAAPQVTYEGSRPSPHIGGHVAAGFERVRECFERNFHRTDDRREVGAGLTVFHHGRCVVDLHGGFGDPQTAQPWRTDTLVNVYSSTKGVVAFCVALLVDRGVLRYEDPVARVWPEFAQGGKECITIGHVLSHQAGLPAFDDPTSLADLYDWDARCAALAAQRPRWIAGELSGYHPVTYGFLAGEIIRRASGRSVGKFLATEIAAPLSADFYIGLPPTLDSRTARLIPPVQLIDPAMIPLPPETRLSVTNPTLQPEWANTTPWRRAELPALNGHASAQALAHIYAVLANGGEFAGQRLLSAATIERMSTAQSRRLDLTLGIEIEWAHGVARDGGTGFFGPNPHSFGHSGWGGSFGCADPEQRLAIGYVCNQMGPDLIGDSRARDLCHAVYQCL